MNLKNFKIEIIKTRDLINLEFQKQFNISKFIIAAITKFYRLQNVVLTIINSYTVDFLIQNEKI